MSLEVRHNLIVDTENGVVLPVQHIRAMRMYGPHATISLAGCPAVTLAIESDENNTEIENLIAAFLTAQANHREMQTLDGRNSSS